MSYRLPDGVSALAEEADSATLAEENELVVPKQIVETFKRPCIDVDWSGSLSQGIALPSFKWKGVVCTAPLVYRYRRRAVIEELCFVTAY